MCAVTCKSEGEKALTILLVPLTLTAILISPLVFTEIMFYDEKAGLSNFF